MTADAARAEGDGGLRRRLWWLVAGRAVVALVMLGVGFFSMRARAAHAVQFDERGALITSVGCAVCYTTLTLAAAAGWSAAGRGAEIAAVSTADLLTNVGLY